VRELARGLKQFCHCELVAEGTGIARERRCPPLEADTRQRLVKTAVCEDLVRVVVNC
jgi:hypothetical protein